MRVFFRPKEINFELAQTFKSSFLLIQILLIGFNNTKVTFFKNIKIYIMWTILTHLN